MTATAPSSSLLVAVTGSPGASKTTLLAAFVAARVARNQRVEGVLAVAGPRVSPDRGASEYRLRFIGGERELPWAVRDETRDPPYRFEPATELKLREWAADLAQRPPIPLLVLDEFGRFERRGEGLMPVWPLLAAARPQIVVVALRQENVGDFVPQLGRPFDVCVDAAGPDALERLLRACDDFGEWTRLGLYGGAAGAVEATVGTALHTARVPCTGLVLSSVQSAMMVYAGTGVSQPGRVVWVPFISAGLKALSPAGSRVRPMVAIIVQGLLFGGSVQFLGWTLPGVALGGALVGGWAALQGLALQYLLLGQDLVKAYDTAVLWIAAHSGLQAPQLPWLVAAWAVLHAGVACGFTLLAWRRRRPPAMLQRIIDQEHARAAAAVPAVPAAPAWSRRWREFARWQFWLPLAAVVAILAGSGQTWEAIAWLVLRFLAVACVLMALLSVLQPVRWAEGLRRRGWWGPALAVSGALGRRRDP